MTSRPKKWKILRSVPAFVNPWWRIVDETVHLPDGSKTHFYVNHSLGGVIVFPLTGRREVIFVRQYKHGARKILLELPVGRVERKDPNPAAAARRELREETGYVPGRLKLIGSFQIFSTSSTGKFWLFIATAARRASRPAYTPKEITEVVRVPLSRLRPMIRQGKIASLHQIGAIYAAMEHLEKLEIRD